MTAVVLLVVLVGTAWVLLNLRWDQTYPVYEPEWVVRALPAVGVMLALSATATWWILIPTLVRIAEDEAPLTTQPVALACAVLTVVTIALLAPGARDATPRRTR